eukprot:TRINITY_DN13419_c0_g2_i1.p1 TRINITY_DN13419_c0_g2~~TRINITY_DN13419_c0_g2_i1.p1  ORF type:complete len:473 (+),score=86.30 TRINITY_DN13419_c0_g2_i1:88-1419(+)
MEFGAAPPVGSASEALRHRCRTASNVGMPSQSPWPSPGPATAQSPQYHFRNRLRTESNVGMPVSPWAMDGLGMGFTAQQQPAKVEPCVMQPAQARSRVCSTLTDDGEAAVSFDPSRPRLRTDSAWGMPMFPSPYRAAASPSSVLSPAPGASAAAAAAAAAASASYAAAAAAAAAAFGHCGGLPPAAAAPPYHMTGLAAPGAAAMPLLGSQWPPQHLQYASMPQGNWLQPPVAPQYCPSPGLPIGASSNVSASSQKQFVSGKGMRQSRPVGSQGYGGGGGGKAASTVTHRAEPARPRTTLVIRGLPGGMTRSQFIYLLDSEGFAGKYNFAYLPIAFDTMTSLKYAFVDMVSTAEADRFWRHFEGFSRWPVPSTQECVCKLEWNDKQQGVADLIERYRNSPVMHESVPEECRPLLMVDGRAAAFPAPTASIKAPKLGRKLAAQEG